MNKNIFDISDTSDLPDDLANQIKAGKDSLFVMNLVALINSTPDRVSVPQLMAAYYRKYGEAVPAKKFTSNLHFVCKNGEIERVCKGIYTRKSK